MMSYPTGWARSVMTHRAVIVRNIGEDEPLPGYQPEPVWDVHLTDVPCLVHADFRSGYSGEVITPSSTNIRELWRILMPRDIDVLEEDVVDNIKLLNGEDYNPNPLQIKVIMRRSIYAYLFVEEIR